MRDYSLTCVLGEQDSAKYRKLEAGSIATKHRFKFWWPILVCPWDHFRSLSRCLAAQTATKDGIIECSATISRKYLVIVRQLGICPKWWSSPQLGQWIKVIPVSKMRAKQDGLIRLRPRLPFWFALLLADHVISVFETASRVAWDWE